MCDGESDTACPALCLPTCLCAASLALPLEGWTRVKGEGFWAVHPDDPESGAPVLTTETTLIPSTGFGIAYPANPTLGSSYPAIVFTIRDDDPFTVEVVVTPQRGSTRLLVYAASDGVGTVRRRRALFPLGARVSSGEFQTTYRDLAADFETAFGVGFSRVEQVVLSGDLSAARILLAERVASDVGSALPDEMRVPMVGWDHRGGGTVVATAYEPVVDGPTLRAEPGQSGTLSLEYPLRVKGDLIAPYGMLSLLVRDEERFAVEVRVRLSSGRVRKLRYRTPAPGQSPRWLPLQLESVEDSPYRHAAIDLESDLRRSDPDQSLERILSLRLKGKFEIGDVVLTRRLD